LVFGYWGLGQFPNPQSPIPIPNPQLADLIKELDFDININ
jgi:hypothetical protein